MKTHKKSSATPDDRERGVYTKWRVNRLNDPEGKHGRCSTFVLDIDHDPFAVPALAAYAAACRDQYPQLSRELEGVWLPEGATDELTRLRQLEAEAVKFFRDLADDGGLVESGAVQWFDEYDQPVTARALRSAYPAIASAAKREVAGG